MMELRENLGAGYRAWLGGARLLICELLHALTVPCARDWPVSAVLRMMCD
jgi:hypothetical protein